MADWEAALDKQLATWLWWDTPAARMIATGWVKDTNVKYGNDDSPEQMITVQRQALWKADPLYVTREMADLLSAAWPTFEPEPLREDDLLLPHGFALLPYPFYIADVWGKRQSVRAICWRTVDSLTRRVDGSVRSGVLVSLYCNWDDTDDYSVDWNMDIMHEIYGEALSMVAQSPIPFGEDANAQFDAIIGRRTDRAELDEDKARMAVMSELRLLQCFWRLTKQRIAVGFQQRPGRATRRRSEKLEYPEKYVTVVTLRRPRNPTSEEEARKGVDWHMRWIVSGHWRWQPYKDGTRQIWISPYLKGPDDKPLVIRGARVFRWAR